MFLGNTIQFVVSLITNVDLSSSFRFFHSARFHLQHASTPLLHRWVRNAPLGEIIPDPKPSKVQPTIDLIVEVALPGSRRPLVVMVPPGDQGIDERRALNRRFGDVFLLAPPREDVEEGQLVLRWICNVSSDLLQACMKDA